MLAASINKILIAFLLCGFMQCGTKTGNPPGAEQDPNAISIPVLAFDFPDNTPSPGLPEDQAFTQSSLTSNTYNAPSYTATTNSVAAYSLFWDFIKRIQQSIVITNATISVLNNAKLFLGKTVTIQEHGISVWVKEEPDDQFKALACQDGKKYLEITWNMDRSEITMKRDFSIGNIDSDDFDLIAEVHWKRTSDGDIDMQLTNNGVPFEAIFKKDTTKYYFEHTKASFDSRQDTFFINGFTGATEEKSSLDTFEPGQWLLTEFDRDGKGQAFAFDIVAPLWCVLVYNRFENSIEDNMNAADLFPGCYGLSFEKGKNTFYTKSNIDEKWQSVRQKADLSTSALTVVEFDENLQCDSAD